MRTARSSSGSFSSGVLTKHYATVGPLTASLDATFDLVEKHKIAAEDIKEIHVDAMRRTAIFNTRHPENDVAARASLPYCLAVAVCRKDPALLLGPAFREELLRDRAIWHHGQGAYYGERRVPAALPRAEPCACDDHAHERAVVFAGRRSQRRGRYLTPTDEDIERKFRLIAVPVLGKAKADKVIALVRELEKLRDVGELVELLKL